MTLKKALGFALTVATVVGIIYLFMIMFDMSFWMVISVIGLTFGAMVVLTAVVSLILWLWKDEGNG